MWKDRVQVFLSIQWLWMQLHLSGSISACICSQARENWPQRLRQSTKAFIDEVVALRPKFGSCSWKSKASENVFAQRVRFKRFWNLQQLVLGTETIFRKHGDSKTWRWFHVVVGFAGRRRPLLKADNSKIWTWRTLFLDFFRHKLLHAAREVCECAWYSLAGYNKAQVYSTITMYIRNYAALLILCVHIFIYEYRYWYWEIPDCTFQVICSFIFSSTSLIEWQITSRPKQSNKSSRSKTFLHQSRRVNSAEVLYLPHHCGSRHSAVWRQWLHQGECPSLAFLRNSAQPAEEGKKTTANKILQTPILAMSEHPPLHKGQGITGDNHPKIDTASAKARASHVLSPMDKHRHAWIGVFFCESLCLLVLAHIRSTIDQDIESEDISFQVLGFHGMKQALCSPKISSFSRGIDQRVVGSGSDFDFVLFHHLKFFFCSIKLSSSRECLHHAMVCNLIRPYLPVLHVTTNLLGDLQLCIFCTRTQVDIEECNIWLQSGKTQRVFCVRSPWIFLKVFVKTNGFISSIGFNKELSVDCPTMFVKQIWVNIEHLAFGFLESTHS